MLLDTHLFFITRYLLTVYVFPHRLLLIIYSGHVISRSLFQFALRIRSSHALLAKVFIVLSSIFHETCYSCSYLSCYCPYHSYCPYIAHILPEYSNIARILNIAPYIARIFCPKFCPLSANIFVNIKLLTYYIIYIINDNIIQFCPHPCPESCFDSAQNPASICCPHPPRIPKYSAPNSSHFLPIFSSILSY